jgi:hypothetical protein
MILSVVESNDCTMFEMSVLQDTGAVYANGSSFTCVFSVYDTEQETLSVTKTLSKTNVQNGKFNVTAAELGGTFMEGDGLLKDSVWKFIITLTGNSSLSHTTTTYMVVSGQIENEIYRRLRRNINSERVQPASYHETLYMYTMVKSLGVLSSLADNDQIVKILNMLKAITVMSKYCAYDVQYINE